MQQKLEQKLTRIVSCLCLIKYRIEAYKWNIPWSFALEIWGLAAACQPVGCHLWCTPQAENTTLYHGVLSMARPDV